MLAGASQVALVAKKLPADAGDAGDALGRSSGGGNGDPLQYFFLENFMDREVWWAIVHGITKSWTQPSMHVGMHMFTDLKENNT